uniref:Uncharacterized protein n=1 Tax=Anguilla anguilla TaxID=7936 RepID=A0A0E9W5A1_ANGAN
MMYNIFSENSGVPCLYDILHGNRGDIIMISCTNV